MFLFVFSLKSIRKEKNSLENKIKKEPAGKEDKENEIREIEKAQDHIENIIIGQYVLWIIFTVCIGFLI